MKLLGIVLTLSLSYSSLGGISLAKIAFEYSQAWHDSLKHYVMEKYNFSNVNEIFRNKSQSRLYELAENFKSDMNDHLRKINENEIISSLFNTGGSQLDEYINTIKNIRCLKSDIHSANYTIIQLTKLTGFDSILKSVVNITTGRKNEELEVSKEMLLSNMFTYIYLLELKREMALHWSYRQLLLLEDRSYLNEMMEVMKKSKENYKKFLQLYPNSIKDDRYLWITKLPEKDKQGLTYDKITNFIQAFVIQPEKLGDDNCDKYTDQLIRIPSVGCARGCNGTIYNCETTEKQLVVCPEGTNSEKRYVYMQSNSISYGKINYTCPNKECTISTSKPNGLCICKCDESNKLSDRYFSSRPISSNMDANKVITGVRLVKRNRIFQFEIEQGVLHGYGNVTDQKWKLVDDWKITDKNIDEKTDYHRLTYDKRQIDLDIVSLPKNQVVTGVRFKKSISGLKLLVRGTEIDIKTGKLNTTRNVWKYNPPASNEISLTDLDVPTKDKEVTQEYLRKRSKGENMFLKFGPSDEKKDAAQTTIPFIDIREVSTKYGPLQGVGLCYKESKGFGGFIAPLVVTFDNKLIADELLKSLEN